MAVPYTQSFDIRGRDFVHAGSASTEIKSVLKSLGINAAVVRRVAIAAYEAEMNAVMYAERATMTFSVTPDVVAISLEDRGPGIADIDLAMQEGWSTATHEMREMGFGAGMGLPNIKRNADKFVIRSEVGKGTMLKIVIYIH
jgi:anti-sigma regulatory factor (Ser/Thr protein kinase)